MSKHRHQNKEEQINNRIYSAIQSNQDKMLNQEERMAEIRPEVKRPALDEGTTRFLAYQIHVKKGGSAIDNWLEAERYLSNGKSTKNTIPNESKPSK